MDYEKIIASWQLDSSLSLCKEQTSIRLTTESSDLINKLCKKFPNVTRNKIINDLITVSLNELKELGEIE